MGANAPSPFMKQIAKVGLADSTHNDAPYADPDWEIWGLPWDEERWLYCNRLFELHSLDLLKSLEVPYVSEERLKEVEVPLYMQESYPDIPNAVEYPLDDVIALTGDYFHSSFAYMMGLAILEEADKLGVWGIDMTEDDEYKYQKSNAEYFIGFARGRGIEVFVPEESALLSFDTKGGAVPNKDWPSRYGYL